MRTSGWNTLNIIIINIIITELYYNSVSDVQRMLSVHKLQ